MPRSPWIAVVALALLVALLVVRVVLVIDPREATLDVHVTGAVAPAPVLVRLRAIETDTVVQRAADGDGHARFEELEPGFYDVSAHGASRETVTPERIRLSPGRRMSIELVLDARVR